MAHSINADGLEQAKLSSPTVLSHVSDTQASSDTDDSNWQELVIHLEKEIGKTAVKNWISPLSFISVQDQTLCICAPTRFLADWVHSHYTDAIRRLWSGLYAPIISIQIEVDTTHSVTDVAPDPLDIKDQPSASEQNNTDTLLGSNLDPKLTFDNFIEGASNALAYAAAQRVASSEEALFSPLFLYGSVGLGKTHLMHAIGWKIQNDFPAKRVVYMPAEKFMYQFVRALRDKDTVSFKQALRDVDVLMIDDIQFISGKASTQQEFIHTFNALLDDRKQIIIAADKHSGEIKGLDERLQSRLAGGLTVDIQPADLELRIAILTHKAKQAEKNIPENVIHFLAEKIETNIRELEGALNRLIAHSDLMNQEITLSSTQSILEDIFRAHNRKITIEDIQKQVADFYKIKVSDMHSNRRLRAIVRPRQAAMFLAKKLTQKSLPEIGRSFGGRDHTTVIHAVRKIEDLLKQDEELSADLTKIENSLKSLR